MSHKPSCIALMLCLLMSACSLQLSAQLKKSDERKLKRIERMDTDRKKVIALSAFAQQIFSREADVGLEQLEKAYALADSLKMNKILPRIKRSLGRMYLEVERYEEAQEHLEGAISMHKESGEPMDMETARDYQDMGRVMSASGAPEGSVPYFKEAIVMQRNLGDSLAVANTAMQLGRAYLLMGEYENAYHAFQMAVPAAEASDDETLFLQAQKAEESTYNLWRDYLEAELIRLQIDQLNVQFDSVRQNLIEEQMLRMKLAGEHDTLKRAKEETEAALAEKHTELEETSSVLASTEEELDKTQDQVLMISGLFLLSALLAVAIGYNYISKQRANRRLNEEIALSNRLLLNILPEKIADELKKFDSAAAQNHPQVSVLFTDFKGFTQIAETLEPKELVAELDECFKRFDEIISKHKVEKIKTIGDAYMAASGLPEYHEHHAINMVKAALDIQTYMQRYQAERIAQGKTPFEARLGIHTGPVVAGIVGKKKFSYDIWGDTVNTAARMESSGKVGKVNISQDTYELVKDVFDCTPRGKVHAKHKGEIEMYFVEGLKESPDPQLALNGSEATA